MQTTPHDRIDNNLIIRNGQVIYLKILSVTNGVKQSEKCYFINVDRSSPEALTALRNSSYWLSCTTCMASKPYKVCMAVFPLVCRHDIHEGTDQRAALVFVHAMYENHGIIGNDRRNLPNDDNFLHHIGILIFKAGIGTGIYVCGAKITNSSCINRPHHRGWPAKKAGVSVCTPAPLRNPRGTT